MSFWFSALYFSRLRSIAVSKRRVWYAFGTLMNPQNLRGKCARTKLRVIEFWITGWTAHSSPLYSSNSAIGHFQVAPSLCFKARLSAKPLIRKWFLYSYANKLIITRKVLHLASTLKWDILESEMLPGSCIVELSFNQCSETIFHVRAPLCLFNKDATHTRHRHRDWNPSHIGGRRVPSPLRHACTLSLKP